MTWLRHVGKPCDHRKELANFPAAPELRQSFHSPGVAGGTAPRSLGIADNPPDVVERACDDEGKKAWPPFDGVDRSFSYQRPHNTLRKQKPLLGWRRTAPLEEQSPLIYDTTRLLRYAERNILRKRVVTRDIH